jgi:hypothetical protein
MKKKIKNFKSFERLNSNDSSHSDNIIKPKRNSKSKEDMTQEELEQVDKNNEELGEFNIKNKWKKKDFIENITQDIWDIYHINMKLLE